MDVQLKLDSNSSSESRRKNEMLQKSLSKLFKKIRSKRGTEKIKKQDQNKSKELPPKSVRGFCICVWGNVGTFCP